MEELKEEKLILPQYWNKHILMEKKKRIRDWGELTQFVLRRVRTGKVLVTEQGECHRIVLEFLTKWFIKWSRSGGSLRFQDGNDGKEGKCF